MNNDVAENPEEHKEEDIASEPENDPVTAPEAEQETPPVEPSAPLSAPVATPALGQSPDPKQNDPITLVLQWLTYAFWSWFALGMIWLSAVAFMFFADSSIQTNWSKIVAYPIAAVIVLFLMAGAIDFFYMKREPAHKTGIATAIMVIHAVIFALCGVGLTIGVVFILIQMVLEARTNSGLVTSLYTMLVGIVVYALLIARVTLVAKVKRMPKIALGSLGAIALLFVILCIVGPMMRSIVTKQDRQVEATLLGIESSIKLYVNKNNKLPDSLDTLDFTDLDTYSPYNTSSMAVDTKDLLSKKVIEYTPNIEPATKTSYGYSVNNFSNSSKPNTNQYTRTTYYYQICATYTTSKGVGGSTYKEYISTNSHNEGRQCYNLKADSVTPSKL